MRPNQTRHHVTSDTEQAGHTPSPRLRGVDGWIITWVPRDRGSRPGVWLLMFLALQSGNGVTSSLWADCSASALSCYFWKPCPPRVLFFISLETLLELLFCHFFFVLRSCIALSLAQLSSLRDENYSALFFPRSISSCK